MLNWLQQFFSGDKDKQATLTGAAAGAATLATVDINRLLAGDRAEILKVVVAAALIVLGYLANKIAPAGPAQNPNTCDPSCSPSKGLHSPECIARMTWGAMESGAPPPTPPGPPPPLQKRSARGAR